MAIVTKTRFSDIVFRSNDAISDRSGSKLVESISVSGANTFIAISNNINNNPKIIATGYSNLGLSIGVKGEGSVKIYSDSAEGSISFQNQNGGGFGFKANVLSSSNYLMVMPNNLPASEKIITINADGEIGYSSVSPGGEISISRQNKSGIDNTTTSVGGYSFKKFNFSLLSDFEIYHQNFLNGILQYGLEVSSTNATSVYSGEADYLFDSENIFFIEEDVTDTDIISVFAK